MHRCLRALRQLVLTAAVALPACLPMQASAAPITYDAFLEGSGISLFTVADPGTGSGSGAWLGSLADAPFPVPARPLSLLTRVNFQFDGLQGLLNGDFEFTDANDFGSTLTGLVTAMFLSGGFDTGGQLSLDYTILAGTGGFGGASGSLISLVDIMAATDGSYREVAVGQFSVPEPGSLLLVAGALAMLVVPGARRRRMAS